MKKILALFWVSAIIVGCSVQAEGPVSPPRLAAATVTMELQIGPDMDLFVALLAHNHTQGHVIQSGVSVDTSIKRIMATGTRLAQNKDTVLSVFIGDTLALSCYTQDNTGDNFRRVIYQERRVVAGSFVWKLAL